MSSTSSAGIGSTLNSGTLIAGGTKTGTVYRVDAHRKGPYVVICKPTRSWTTAPSGCSRSEPRAGLAPVERLRSTGALPRADPHR